MKTPVALAHDLMNNHFEWIEKYYAGDARDNGWGNPDKTICRISEWLNRPTYYANQTFKGWEIGVEVQIFYKKGSGFSTIDEEIKIAKLFVANGWTVEQSKPHIKDPDTGQSTKVFYFAKDLIMKESEANGSRTFS